MPDVFASTPALLSPELATRTAAPRSAHAAREFEATLIASLLASLEKTFATVPGESGLAGDDDYNYLGTQALAEGIAARGGFGIAEMIRQHLPAAGSNHEGNKAE